MYKGKMVNLRPYRREDIPRILELINDEEIKSLLTPGIPFPYTFEDEVKWYESLTATSSGTYNFAIETLAEKLYLGGCGINSVDWKNSVVEVGIFIGDKAYLGKGYGTDAMQTLIGFIFKEMNIRKIKLNVYSFNPRAIKSYEKLGFVREGTLRREIFRAGEYHDIYVMGLFKDEWQ
ncbi:MAG TPA: N-acetyltransferase [Clostridiales bacterium UBA8960]|jgi:RimJ/RimL family protein N-acetyltransferase|nr:N-acetyltransferase [Clostridiales bacterium UBA8960]